MTKNTLGATFSCSGIGLHSGILTNVKVLPAKPGEGRYFVRVDLPESQIIPAHVDAVCETTLSTELGNGANSHRVRTVEHLLAGLAGSGVDDARIEIDGSEVPLLDGSANPWVEAIAKVGIMGSEDRLKKGQGAGDRGGGEEEEKLTSLSFSPSFSIEEPIWIYHGDAFVAAIPAPSLRFTYGIDFDVPAIGNQWYSWTPSQSSFADEIAPARTFGLLHQIEGLRNRGLIKGGSLDNALVCDRQGWLNPPLRFSNEPVRHKLLDLVGDLSLLGTFPVAHFLAYKASHNLHVQLARQISSLVRNP
ncbi:MAG TPA: UDP-3-O-acyl-N-acetylglucosamine deacetylase [Cyanobacteria bacterium UBA11149]|nr:UDP-3-O-acyl-N-acetylglucosamine deacetylase [Cyanobacteria bacterium UBA11367]HBE57049.1 UDP-3-O-acyl-N-acetylglucosamine deacetylase [Cyanobacteria bacterium UBA11366]HBK63368.1 UDP-3-O-acyl-N-acetylglucosamine deacetylase [Cyanobacteria bacterium UBA11166]HBR74344.1 UDP-3-O-acyl-N-acetylglucosamine deacetylase [Cyanobacteria bacterium UBA11159]HBS68696.1 UDP-3-O-acyl-N-acetylglucosamine deacetylase [Cyanobacteria bacterium UBA11153]HBW88911.1 UDP-3-O-acyl-N-acetylglucosamine deacetylase 